MSFSLFLPVSLTRCFLSHLRLTLFDQFDQFAGLSVNPIAFIEVTSLHYVQGEAPHRQKLVSVWVKLQAPDQELDLPRSGLIWFVGLMCFWGNVRSKFKGLTMSCYSSWLQHTHRHTTDLCVCVLTPPSVALVDSRTRLSVAFHSHIKQEKRLGAPRRLHSPANVSC